MTRRRASLISSIVLLSLVLGQFLTACGPAAPRTAESAPTRLPETDTPSGPTLSPTPKKFVLMATLVTKTPTVNPRITPTLTNTPVYTSTPRPVKPFTFLKLIPGDERARLYQRYELTIQTDGQAGNPFDADEASLLVTFTAPDGTRVTIPAFYAQEFDRATLDPVGAPAWKARFSPTAPGRWTAQVMLEQGGLQSEPLAFDVDESDSKGFIRLNRKNPAYFQYDSGDFYFPVGVNMSWSTGDVLGDYERWLDRFSASGGNLIRVWMASWSFGLEWNDTGLGDYTARLRRAWLLDQVFELAEARGVSIMLCLINHGMFSATTNPEWENNPYNALLGGPLQSPEQFVTDETARSLFKRRLRYTAARWSYSTSLFAWEWWNEINWTPITDDLLRPWLAEMTAYLRGVDPYNHLVTHSTSSTGSIWDAPELQIAQIHDYSGTFLPVTLEPILEQYHKIAPGKPVLLGEYGMDSSGEADLFKNQPIHLHNGLWAPPFLGYAGTGMYWWWDNYIDPNNHWDQYGPAWQFFKGEDLAEYRPGKGSLSDPRGLALSLQQADRALAWIISSDSSGGAARAAYNKALQANANEPVPNWRYDPPAIENAMLTITGLRDGPYRAFFFDTNRGAWSEAVEARCSGGRIYLFIPGFNTDLAVKILPQGAAAPENAPEP